MASSRSTTERAETETSQLLAMLKKILKDRKLPYRLLADELKMSEANVKRIFSQRSLSVSTLMRICEAVGITLQDLVAMSARNSTGSYRISAEAETYFVQNFESFLFFRRIGFQHSKIGFHPGVSNTDESKWLRRLIELGLVRTERSGRVWIVDRRALELSPASPLRKEVERRWAPWLLERAINQRDLPGSEVRVFSTGLCAENRDALIRELDDLLNRYRQIGWLDQQPGRPQALDVGLCFALGPVRVGDFEGAELPTTRLAAGRPQFRRATPDPMPKA